MFNIFNVFQRKSSSLQLKSLLKSESLEEFIYSASHLEKHTLAIALFNAARLINLLDPNNEIEIQQKDMDLQDESIILELAESIILISEKAYIDNKEIIDLNYRKHLH